MSYLLYRNGNKHVIWGKGCEYRQFNDEDVDQALKDGWVDHPNKLVDEKVVESPLAEAIEDASFEEIDTNDSGKLSNEEIREAAKKAGIEDWETKRIKTLKDLLGV